MTILMILIVLAAIAVLFLAAAAVALRDVQELLRWMEDDAFTTSARRWGYVGVKRGGK